MVKKECRAQALSLLCTFVRHQPPHLYEVLKTPLLDHLLTCLMIDTSTTVISLALTTLVMFLPHVPSSLVPYLPRLFAVYARIICWEKYGQDRGVDEPANENSGVELSSSPPEESDVYTDPTWDKLHHSVDMADSTTPDLSHYFTFLYGLYPLNFMSFIRKPAKYLRDAKFSSGDEVKADQLAIHQRTEQFRQVHLLHPNFYTLTVDSELTDANRFLESEPADVVAECMALCAAVPLSLTDPGPPPSGKLPLIPKSQVATEDIPPQSLLASDDGATLTNGDDSPTESRLPASWRNTQSSMASADQSKLLRKSSQRSHGRPSSRPNGVSSRYSSPSSRVNDRNQDSPTLPAHLIQSSSDTNLKDMLQAQESLRTIIHEHTNDSNQSLSAPETSSPRLDAYIQSLSQNTPSRSPAARMKISGPQPKVAYLQREILLLKNDLNFERYLKQQHLSHIGQLQRKYIREATVEAETQKLINSNRALKIKQEEAKKMLATLRKETAASKNHAKKWEGELHQKARALREDQKTWRSEEDALRRELREARDECDHLRGLVLESEARELMSRQKLQQVELNMDELQSLRVEVEGLNARLREYESRQEEFDFGKQNEEIARTQLETLRIKLKARDSDREKMKRSYDQRIGELELRLQASQNPMSPQTPQAFQSMLDSALASSQVRFTQLKKLYNHLLNRYAELEMKYMESRAGDERGDPHGHTGRPQVYVGEEFDFFGQDDGTAEFSKRQLATSNPYGPHNAYKPGMHGVSLAEPFSASYPTHPAQLESLIGIEPGSSNNSPGVDRTTPFENSLSTFKSQQSDGSEYSGPPPSAANSAPGNPPAKIKASSEGRVYGRGIFYCFVVRCGMLTDYYHRRRTEHRKESQAGKNKGKRSEQGEDAAQTRTGSQGDQRLCLKAWRAHEQSVRPCHIWSTALPLHFATKSCLLEQHERDASQRSSDGKALKETMEWYRGGRMLDAKPFFPYTFALSESGYPLLLDGARVVSDG